MGMAASQARFLTLTARKSNTEYQGQQVNQQRTALANESANIYNKLANMEVPTVPSKTSYNSSIYSFKDVNGEKYSITNIANINPNNKNEVLVKIKYNTLANNAAHYNIGSIDSCSLKKADGTINTDASSGTLITTYNSIETKYQLTKCVTGEGVDGKKLPSEIATATKDKPQYDGGAWYFVQQLDDEGKASSAGLYIHSNELETKKDANGDAVSYNPQYYTVETNSTPASKEIRATMVQNNNQRYTSVKLNDEDAKSIGLKEGGEINLSYEYGTDEDAYEQAMADYEFKKAQYDQEVNVLNNKTEIIQNQDKRLELKLKQLDTERQALDTEMEAVKGYLKKNVEGTFNTFG